MADAVIDACCLIDLLASGDVEAILRASGFTWHLPSAARNEVQYCRRHNPDQPGKVVTTPADLSGLIASGLLTVCAPESQKELDRYVRYAAVFRSDGESMCLALAEQRMWVVATDDRKAIRVAAQAGLTVVSCPELVKTWADVSGMERSVLGQVLKDIETLARFRPNASMPHCRWWIDHVS